MILKILNYIFVTLGIIFLILITAVVIFIVVDPFNLKSLFSIANFKAENFNVEEISKNLTSNITTENIDCFVKVLGEKRVQEIMSGSAIGPSDIFKAKDCLAK